MSKLTPKQTRFVDEYLLDLNATQAAIRAGYSKKTARQVASENLSKPDIAKAIAKAKQERAERTMINSNRVLIELASLAFANMQNFFDKNGELLPIQEMEPDVAAGIQDLSSKANDRGHTYSINLAWKLKCLELLGRHLGLFTNKVEHVHQSGKHSIQELLDKTRFENDSDSCQNEISD